MHHTAHVESYPDKLTRRDQQFKAYWRRLLLTGLVLLREPVHVCCCACPGCCSFGRRSGG